MTGIMVNIKSNEEKEKGMKDVHFFEKVAQENPDGYYHLGHSYKLGINSARNDLNRSFDYFKQGYEKGSMKCAYALGDCYHFGNGVRRNSRTALRYYKEAFEKLYLEAENGDMISQDIIGDYFMRGDSMGQQRDTIEALKWYKIAVENGNANAQLGFYNCYGNKCYSDAKWLETFYEQAQNGDKYCQCFIGDHFYAGSPGINGQRRDYEKAFYWYALSAEQGYASAQYSLGSLYAHGTGVEQDFKKAIEWYSKAAEQGYDNAKIRLLELEKVLD